MPSFKLGNGILFCEDAYKVLKEIEQVDLLLTDPPYLINYTPSWRVKDFQGFKDYLPDLEELAFLFHQVLKNNRHAYVFTHYKTYHLFFEAFSKFFRIKNALVWVKNNWTAGDLKGQYAPSYELILFMHKGRRPLWGKRERDVLFFKRVPPPPFASYTKTYRPPKVSYRKINLSTRGCLRPICRQWFNAHSC